MYLPKNIIQKKNNIQNIIENRLNISTQKRTIVFFAHYHINVYVGLKNVTGSNKM